jgi:hypothetical protein
VAPWRRGAVAPPRAAMATLSGKIAKGFIFFTFGKA